MHLLYYLGRGRDCISKIDSLHYKIPKSIAKSWPRTENNHASTAKSKTTSLCIKVQKSKRLLLSQCPPCVHPTTPAELIVFHHYHGILWSLSRIFLRMVLKPCGLIVDPAIDASEMGKLSLLAELRILYGLDPSILEFPPSSSRRNGSPWGVLNFERSSQG